jgi:hypothetical protein
MKNFNIIISILLLSINAFAQESNWVWAQSHGGNRNDQANSIATDETGNIYVAGWFYSKSIVFGTITLANSDTSGLTSDIFLVKYDANGNVIWAKRSGGINGDGVNSVKTDLFGNVFITGWFYSPIIRFGTTTLSNSDNTGNTYDIHVVKFNSNGNVIWAKRVGSNNNETGRSIDVDASDKVYVTGWFYSTSFTAGTFTLTNYDNSGNTNDIYILKLDINGDVLWAIQNGGDDNDHGESIKSDVFGNVYVTGGFYSSNLDFGSTTLTATIGAFGPADDYFLAKYDVNGNILWAKGAGGNGGDDGNSLAIDHSGNVFVTGWFFSKFIDFDPIQLTNASPSGAIQADVFLVKYAPGGNALWATRAGSFAEDFGNSVTLDDIGNPYVTGYFFSDEIVFGSTTIINGSAVGFSSPNTFIAKYDTDGSSIWAKSASGTRSDFGLSIAADAMENIYVTGGFWSPKINFGNTTLTNFDNTGDTYDIYFIKISSTVGIKEVTNGAGVSIYPNPFNSQATIDFGEEQNESVIEIYDVLGKQIKSQFFTGRRLILEKENLHDGIYFVKITDKLKNTTIKTMMIQ